MSTIREQLIKEKYQVELRSSIQLKPVNPELVPHTIILDTLGLSTKSIKRVLDQLTTHLGHSQNTTPPVLAVVNIESKDKQQIFNLGIKDYISFPIIKEELVYRVNQVINCFNYSKGDFLNPIYEKSSSAGSEHILVEKTMEYLTPRLNDEITLDTLTRKIGTNRNKLNQAFKACFGLTVFAWLRDQRMHKAAELLENTELTITQISEQVGYPDSNNFSSSFKRIFQISPLQYRQSKHRTVHESKK
ncbi:AraC family transcriptional regulator [Pseudoalteromonas sp. McH1-42]|uniref:helix-turn-helix transcriptional regulator n=1 Tax=Pseudoalteromonas sp. McH1-42 TaxID=2917752 RepID=UPI001EF49995|nr:AraC family transcriptional regulator [Pseudoalteromonas sp. McH1-42]MCG7564555.1 AraC family transcriptional regulator [Pseudoalteromonas sp. McH1-42]